MLLFVLTMRIIGLIWLVTAFILILTGVLKLNINTLGEIVGGTSTTEVIVLVTIGLVISLVGIVGKHVIICFEKRRNRF